MPYYSPNVTYPTQPNMYPMQMNVAPTQSALQQPTAPQQVQNGGFLSVPSEDIVRSYPVAPGNCVTFKIEGQPIVMEKSMGFSQLEAPRVERYRLVKEGPAEPSDLTKGELYDDQPIKDTLDDLRGQIERIWDEIDGLKKKPRRKEPHDDTE